MGRLSLVLIVCALLAACSGSDGSSRFGGAYGGIGVGAAKP